MPKGRVSIQSNKSTAGVSWLRLVWTYQSKRYFLSVGLEDTPLNRTVAQSLALKIEGDCATGNFDTSLAKYKSRGVEQKKTGASLKDILDKYLEIKSLQVESETIDKYKQFLPRIYEYFKDKTVNQKTAFGFRDWLLERNQPITVRERIVFLDAAYKWAIARNLTTENPWSDVTVKVPPKRPPKPFTREEIIRILEEFKTNQYYKHYYPYVEFLFTTGCRPGEANGLQWKHVSEDCSEVLINCKLTERKERKTTKTNRDRIIPIPPRLQKTLLSIKPDLLDPESPLFLSPKGSTIDARCFRRRAWKVVLKKLNIPYRKPGTTRHTMISHGLQQGKSPVELAELAGNTVETIYTNYAGSVIHRPTLPDVFYEEE